MAWARFRKGLIVKLSRHLTLIKPAPRSSERSERQREDEGTRLNLKYTAALDRQARIRLANRLASTRASDDGAA